MERNDNGDASKCGGVGKMKYRKKPIVVEAVQYQGAGNVTEIADWICSAFESGVLAATNGCDPLIVRTPSGPITVSPGDWIIEGVNGELYPCKPDIFEKTYEEVL